MNFTNELKQLDKAYKIVDLAEEQVAKRFEIEVKKMLAKYKKYNYSYTSGNGTHFFSKDGEIVHDEIKLPVDMQKLCHFMDDNDYIQKYIIHIPRRIP